MLAALADLPQATFASKVEVEDGKAKVTREVDGGSMSPAAFPAPSSSWPA
jgi:electron transfer flavoprotein alpha/beta subunit